MENSHLYTVAAIGIKARSRTYNTRRDANEYMYRLVRKHNLTLKEVWDDKHYKTYNFSNGIKIFVNRVL